MRRATIAVVGAGFMARRRARAFLLTGRAEVRGIASRHLETARAFGEEIGCRACFDDFRRLAEVRPDAVLIEVPNAAQDEIASWALSEGLHVLIGGPLSVSVSGGLTIKRSAEARGLVVEAGYEARYKAAWETTRRIIVGGEIGRVVAAQTAALWNCAPGSWYSKQRETGGMPLAHMTYAFVNPLRWIFGEPTHLSAFANRLKTTAPGSVEEETCVANLLFQDSVICSMLAGFVRPYGNAERDDDSWLVRVLGTDGAIELYPSEMGNGHLKILRGGTVETLDFSERRDAFEAQAAAFLASLGGEPLCRNPPGEAVGDLRVAEAIVESARGMKAVRLGIGSAGESAGP